jgi:hypothetical protein
MEWYRAKHSDSAPSLYLMLTGIILAIALENLVGRVATLGALSGMTKVNILIWLEGALILQQIVLVWIVTAQVFHNLRWRFDLFDTFLPFSIGLSLLLSIAWVGPESMLSFFALGTIASVGTGLSLRSNLLSSAENPDNREVLANFSGFGIYGSAFGVGAISAVAVILLIAGPQSIGLMIFPLMISNCVSAIAIASWLRGLSRVLEAPREEAV